MAIAHATPGEDHMEKVLQAFRLTWLDFPHPAFLLRGDRTILAVNSVAAGRGGEVGGKCYQLSGRRAVCEHCRADAALQEETTKSWFGQSKDKFYGAYWIPMRETANLYVHVAIEITQYVRPELMKPYP
jgi:hypothetical protein